MSESNVLGFVPARGGSKGIPGKNIKPFAGRPLIEHAIACSLAVPEISRTVVSTEDASIAGVARRAGAEVPFLRPRELARDETPMLDVLQHAVRTVEESGWVADLIVLLQPTAPLRTPQQVRHAIRIAMSTGCDSVVSVVQVPAHYAPHYVMRIEGEQLTFFLTEGARVTRRQDTIPAYSRDGTVYVTRRRVLMEEGSIYGTDCRPIIMNHAESANLDTPEDWTRAEAIFERRARDRS